MSRRRQASHAGSWYSDDREELSQQLDQWLEKVPKSAACIGVLSKSGSHAQFPTPGSRVIIAPYAESPLEMIITYRGKGMPAIRTLVLLRLGRTKL